MDDYTRMVAAALFGKSLEEAAKDYLREEAAKHDDRTQDATGQPVLAGSPGY